MPLPDLTESTPIAWREATEADAPLLAEINRQLIAEEWGGETSLERLERRVREWLREGDYRGVLFEENGETAAFALFSLDEDSAYIRQFFVMPAFRRGGVGRRAIATLFADIIPPTVRTTLDVLASNPGGYAFWRSVGFADYSVRMERPAEPR